MKHKISIFLIVILILGIAWQNTGFSSAQERAELILSIQPTGRVIPAEILGNNVQWIDAGDNILKPNSLEFEPKLVETVAQLGPTVLRYPGGSLSDLYHWKDGIGFAPQRKKNKRFHATGEQTIYFGTHEFLILCQVVGAAPLITVNVASGTPEEAAEWVRYVNFQNLSFAGKPLPKVKYWEIGNEPYLEPDIHKNLKMEPEEFARRVNLFIRAMKAADPSIMVGVPLRSDSIGGVPATPFVGFNRKVLSNLKEPFEFVSLHNAYLPVPFESKITDEALYRATMASSEVVREDIRHTKSMLRQYFPGRSVKIAITEYNSLYTIGKSTDVYIASLTSALYIADLLSLFAKDKDVFMANFWSLTANWYFGTTTQKGAKRPAYHVLQGFREFVGSNILSISLKTQTLKSGKVGFVPEKEVPSLSALASRKGNSVYLWVVNKSFDAETDLEIKFENETQEIRSISMKELSFRHFFVQNEDQNNFTWTNRQLPKSFADLSVLLKPRSINIIQLDLA